MGKGRPEKLTDGLKVEIAKIRGKCPKLKAPAVREELKQWLIGKARKDVDERQLLIEVENRLPGISVIQKHIHFTSSNYKKLEELEKPWHLGLMGEYSISHETVIYILAVQTWAEHNQHEPVTIGQAQWIARLYSCISDIRDKRDIKDRDKDLDWLWHRSRAYAIEEIISDLAGVPLDTSCLDKSIREFAHIEVFDNWAYAIFTKDGELFDREVKNERTHNTAK